MGDKSLQKKKYILDTSKKVFVEKGYAAVTMKDIVEACDISRGGLYIHFDSTKALFEELIESELKKESSEAFDGMTGTVTKTDILKIYMREQKRDILNYKDSLTVAIYEYCFGAKDKGVKTITDNQMKSNIVFLENLFKLGNDTGEFNVDNPKRVARNMFYAFEGLKLLNRTGNITEKMIDDEISFLLQDIIPLK